MLPRKWFLVICAFGVLSCFGPVVIAGTTTSNQTTAADVRQETSEALKTLASFSADQRDAAVATAKEALAKTDARIEEVQRRVDRDWQKMDKTARQQARETLNALQKQRTEIAEWYGGLEHSSASAWEEIKKGFSKSYSALERSIEKAWDKF